LKKGDLEGVFHAQDCGYHKEIIEGDPVSGNLETPAIAARVGELN
jgi:hypothetical protein